MFLSLQTQRQTEAIALDATSTIYGSILELDKTFLAYLELRPYSYSGEVISPTDKFDTNYNRVILIAEYRLDCLIYSGHTHLICARDKIGVLGRHGCR
jgi:hypothetical protein